MNLILCGLPMSGKSTFARQVAECIQWQWIDTDQWIEALYQKERGETLSCRSLARQHGAAYFRALERRVLESLIGIDRAVISLGGGTLHFLNNHLIVKQLGKVVYLAAPLDLIWQRLEQQIDLPTTLDPNCPRASLEQLADQRIPHYQQVADQTLLLGHLSDSEVLHQLVQVATYGK